MAPRVKRVAGQGASVIGGMTARKVQAADTPFQTMRAPDLNSGSAGAAAARAKGFRDATQGIALFGAIADKSTHDALMVTADLEISKAKQDGVASWVLPYKNALTGEVNEGNATGARANTKGWIDKQLSDLDDKYATIKSGDEYASMSDGSKAALDQWYASQRKGHRASAVTHNTKAAEDYLTAQLSASETQSFAAAENNAMNASAAHASLKKAMSTIEQQAKQKGNSWKDNDIQLQATQALDKHADTVITSILSSDLPDKVAKANQWMAANSAIEVGSHTVKLTPAVRQKLNQTIARGKAGIVNRDRGDKLFDKYRDNEPAAMAALKKDKELSLEDFNATKSQFQERQRMDDAHEERVKTDKYNAANKQAANRHVFTPAELDHFTAEEQETLKAISLHSRELALAPSDRPTVYATKLAWDMMLPEDQAKIPPGDIVRVWLKDMGLANGDHDRVVEEYNKARSNVGAKQLVLSKYQKKQVSAEQKAARSYFDTQLTNTIAALKGKGTDELLTATQQGLFKRAAVREFAERNNETTNAQGNKITKPMTNAETEKLLTDLTSAILLKTGYPDDDATMAVLLNDLVDENGKPVKGSATISATLRSVPVADRFEMIRWYSKTAKVVKGQLDATKLDAFITKWHPTSGTALMSDIPAGDLKLIKKHLGSSVSAAAALRFYRETMMAEAR